MKRKLLHVLAAVSLVLCLVVVCLGIKSRTLGDSGGWAWYDGGSRVYHSLQIDSAGGSMGFGGLDFVYDRAYLGEGKRVPPPESWATGWFWQNNISTLVPPQGWFASGSVWNRAGFDAFDVVTLTGHDRWRHWGVVVPDWLLVGVLLVVPGIWALGLPKRRQVARRRREGLCLTCGYDLRAHAAGGKCPECGTAIAVPALKK